MNHDEYAAIVAEVAELESLLSEIPEDHVIERIGIEARLKSARAAVAGVANPYLVQKARLIFRGRPVFHSHGIAADFSAKAAGSFVDAVSAIAAGLSEGLRYMGPIPDKQKNQLLITGTAIGSFGFEFELPSPEDGTLPLEPNAAETALQKLQDLLRSAADGTDDDVAELVDEIHPRAVKKTAEFLDYVAQQDAWCGLEFRGHFFRFNDVEQLRLSAIRLHEDNIRQADEEYFGEFQGVLPSSRSFEFKLADQHAVLRGKVGLEIEDADVLNRKFLHKPVSVKLHAIHVGQGRPRYSIASLDQIKLEPAIRGS